MVEVDAILKNSRGTTARDRENLFTGMIELYAARHDDAKSAEWRAKLSEWQVSTQPAAAQRNP